MLKSYIISLAFLFFFISCSKEKHIEFNKKIIDKISKESLEFPSRYNSIILFCKCRENNITLTYVQELRGIYKYKYNKMKFTDFLSDALNQKLDISYKDKIECLEINKEVKNIYEKDTFDKFLNFYCEKPCKERYRIKKNISENQLKTVLYYFFINNYLPIFDDHIGYYYITKADLLL